MPNTPLRNRQEAIAALAAHNITGAQVYLIDLVPLIEMMWADGKVQSAEVELLENFATVHLKRINHAVGHEALTADSLDRFIKRFTEQRPDAQLLETIRALLPKVRLSSSDELGNQALRESLLAWCLDIAAASTTEYPYGMNERFCAAEKRCFFEILNTLDPPLKPESV
jgi:hypothetical protein